MPANQNISEWKEILIDRIKRLRYGKIELLIHQGRVTQLKITERVRLEEGLSPQERPPEQTNSQPQ